MKNVIFDFGQVLIRFEPSYMVGRYISDPDDAALVASVLFDRLYWDRLDAGTVTDEAVLAEVNERLPERLWQVTSEIYYNWIYNIPEIEGMSDLVRYIKEKFNARVFLLSNISRYFSDHAGDIPILSLFDGCVFSAECKKVKPNADIYKHLCSEYNILPEESIFVDDRKENIEGAEKLGITGYLFDGNVDKLKAYLEKALG